MAQRNMSGTNMKHRLTVKIIGGKQVKQFIEEPQADLSEKEAANADLSEQRLQQRLDSALWAAIKQVPDRVCVTAPSADRSRSFIHTKTHITDPRAAADTEQKHVFEVRNKAELSSAVRDELSDWPIPALTSTEDEVAAFDSASGEKLHRSDITHLFLKNKVPLTLPTFSLLLQMFSDENDPDQVHYRKLIQFIRCSAFLEENPTDAASEQLNKDGGHSL